MMLVGAGILWVGWNGFVSFLYGQSGTAFGKLLLTMARTVVILTLLLLMPVLPF